MSDLLEKWLLHYDPVHRGFTPRGIANGVCATRGFSFPRVSGGYNLYRSNEVINDIEFASPVGVAGANAVSIQTFVWQPAPASATRYFALTAIGGGGVESAAGSLQVRIEFDNEGDPVAPAPNSPVDLHVSPRAGGRFEIVWRYHERDQAVAPNSFDVYDGASEAAVDYESPIANVAYRARAGWFSVITDAHAHDAMRCFAVRAVSAAGTNDGNTFVVSRRARAAGPPVHKEVYSELAEAE